MELAVQHFIYIYVHIYIIIYVFFLHMPMFVNIYLTFENNNQC